MDTVTILRDLWRLRRYVAGVALIAVLAGTAVVFKVMYPPELQSRRYEVGIATARILVDTPSSQVVEVSPKGSDTLGVRANLLASLMVDGVVKSAIARRAGMPPGKLVGITEAASVPSVVSTRLRPRDIALTTRVLTNTGGDQLPIIEIEAQAQNRIGAATLASAAVAGLGDYLNSKAALQRVKDADRLRVTGLGAPDARTVVRGPSNLIAIAVMIFFFVLGCACVLGLVALTRGWRTAARREQLRDDASRLEQVGSAPGEHSLDELSETPARARLAARLAEDTRDNSPSARPTLVVPPSGDDRFSDARDEAPQAKSV